MESLEAHFEPHFAIIAFITISKLGCLFNADADWKKREAEAAANIGERQSERGTRSNVANAVRPHKHFSQQQRRAFQKVCSSDVQVAISN